MDKESQKCPKNNILLLSLLSLLSDFFTFTLSSPNYKTKNIITLPRLYFKSPRYDFSKIIKEINKEINTNLHFLTVVFVLRVQKTRKNKATFSPKFLTFGSKTNISL